MPADEQINWEMVRLQVKAGEMTRQRICAAHGITMQRLARRIRENKWDVDEDSTDHDRKIIKDRVVPDWLIASGKHLLGRREGLDPPGGIWCHITGTDLVPTRYFAVESRKAKQIVARIMRPMAFSRSRAAPPMRS